MVLMNNQHIVNIISRLLELACQKDCVLELQSNNASFNCANRKRNFRALNTNIKIP
jgi:hypothetical protein